MKRFCVGLFLAGFCSSQSHAALMPNDASVAGSLDIWLTDAANQFNGATWADQSGNGNDASAVGLRAANGALVPEVTYLAGTLSNQFGTVGLAFSGSVDDLMKAGTSFNGTEDLTVIIAYATSGASAETRPAGVGSFAENGENDGGGRLNLATDGSLRYDNGNNIGSANATGMLMVRATRLDSGAVADWINGAENITNTSASSGGTIPNPLGANADAFYIGDVRAGATTVDNATSTDDLFIAQVAVYRAALTDQQILDISEWMQTNPNGVPEPTSLALLGIGGLTMLRRNRNSR